MKRTPPRKTVGMRMREAPKALLCVLLALALSVGPAPALAREYRSEAPAPVAASSVQAGVTVESSGVTINGAFVSKNDFLAAIAVAKRVAYLQGPQTGQVALQTGGMRTPIVPVPSGTPLQRASYGEGSSGAIVATTTANVIRKGLEALWGAAMDRVTYLASSAFARNTAWLVAVGGAEYLLVFTDAGDLILLAGTLTCSIAPCWFSIAVAQYAADHANDPIAGEDEAPPATLDDILEGATHSPKPGDVDAWLKPGDYDDALADQARMKPSDTREIDTPFGPGKQGRLPNGDTLVARPGSKSGPGEDGYPTLEFQHRGPSGKVETSTKIRYTG